MKNTSHEGTKAQRHGEYGEIFCFIRNIRYP